MAEIAASLLPQWLNILSFMRSQLTQCGQPLCTVSMVTKVNMLNGEIFCSGIGSDMLCLDLISVGVDHSRCATRRSAPRFGEIRLLISQ